MKKSFLILSIFSALFLLNCKKEKAADPTAKTPESCPTVAFSSEVLPVFTNNCSFSGCHNATSSNGALDNHANISAYNSDRLLGAIKHAGGYSAMPQNASKLSQSDIDKIECWIVNGKPNN